MKMEPYTYNQPQKEKARKEMFKHVINMLTSSRSEACCVRNSYVREIFEELRDNSFQSNDAREASQLSLKYIELWEEFHKAHVAVRLPKDLTVCYLCGPEPMNDFRVLVELGIHPHNIWAFESNDEIYKSALLEISNSDFPMLKIHKGSIENFFIDTPKKFDIVYLDACGPLPSRGQHTLRLISTLLRYHRLNSPGALVTNFACPDLDSIEQKDNYTYLVSSYLYPKQYLEGYDLEGNPIYIEGPSRIDSSEVIKSNFSTFYEQVKSNFEFYYSQYITRQIFDLASFIIPWSRLVNSNHWHQFFSATPDIIAQNTKYMRVFGVDNKDGDIIVEPYNYPLQWTLCSINGIDKSGTSYGRYPTPPNSMNKFKKTWIDDLAGLPSQPYQVRDAIECSDFLKNHSQYYTERLLKSIEMFNYRNKLFQFCDVPSKSLGFDLITNQLSYPMHYTVDATKRWTYKAKDTQMYLDAIILDECRYIYEWLPTIDLLSEAFENNGQQLSYRFALDGLFKNRRWYNTEYFFGASVVNQDKTGFEAKVLKPRIEI